MKELNRTLFVLNMVFRSRLSHFSWVVVQNISLKQKGGFPMGGTSESDRKLLALPGVAGVAGVAGTGVAGGVLGGKELVVEIRPLAKSHMKNACQWV